MRALCSTLITLKKTLENNFAEELLPYINIVRKRPTETVQVLKIKYQLDRKSISKTYSIFAKNTAF